MKQMQKPKQIKRHPLRGVLGLLALILLYLVTGAIIPFLKQPEPGAACGQFNPADAYTNTPGIERAAIISDNNEAFLRRFQLISQAREQIILSSYDFKADASGLSLLAALYDAAERGVQVKIIVDGLNAVTKVQYNPYFQALSAHENGEVRIYNPFKPWLPWRLMGRMHDKYLIADDFAYLLGGRNTHDAFLKSDTESMCYDWDALLYTAQAEGVSSLDTLEAYFSQVWEKEYTKPLPADKTLGKRTRVQRAAQALRERFADLCREHPEYTEAPDYNALTVPVNQVSLLHNPTDLYAKEPVVFHAMTQLMLTAEEEVFIHTPYISCNSWMLERLTQACGKQAQVSLMTNSVANNANPLGSMDYFANRKKILATGLQLLEYDGGTSYHGKCMSIDNRLSVIGSFNLDMRSTYIDTELMLVIDSAELNRMLREKMERYEARSLIVRQSLSGDIKTIAPAGLEAQPIATGRCIAEFFLRPILKLIRFLI